MTTILPVKAVLKASIAAKAVSLSPKTTKVLGSMIYLLMNFLCAKAGTCSGMTI